MTTKAFKLRADQIRRLVPEMGRCIASDQITVAGKRVGFIIPLLDAPPRSAFARDPGTGDFVEEPYPGGE